MYIIEMLPNEAAYLAVLWNCLIQPISHLVACHRALDAAVVHKWPGNMGNFRLQDKGDVFVEYGSGICPSLRQTC